MMEYPYQVINPEGPAYCRPPKVAGTHAAPSCI